MTTTSQNITRLCKNFIATVALPAVVAILGTATAHAGALFTTDAGCVKVNGNIYADKTDVFLNGGPDGNGSQLEASTTYCIRVSAPGCKDNLNTIPGTITTDLNGNFPCTNLFLVTGFDNTCNPGGEYKVEACPIEGDVCVFRPGNQCKSDNFKVGTTPTCPDSATVCIFCPDDVNVPCKERTFGQCATVTYRPSFVIGGTATCLPASGSCFDVGDTLVTCTVDGSDPALSCSFTVTVENCPQECTLPIIPPVGACSCSGPTAVLYTAPATLTDGNGIVFTLGSCSPASGTSFSVGTTTVLCTYTDSAGDECDNSFGVTVTEDAGPKITCPKDVELQCGDSTDPANTGCATYTGDACGGKVTISHSDAATAANCTGKAGIARTWTATDTCLKTDSCVQKITFADSKGPSITGPSAPITVNTCAPAKCATAAFTVTATDNCGGSPTIVCKDQNNNVVKSGDCFPVGITTVTCTATDACNNSSAPCNFTITVRSYICGGLTMGFWQNKNGQGIISSADQLKLQAWLKCYHPFSDAPSSGLALYVYNIIKAATCTSTSKTCNSMLRAQMLATALDVYFSDLALGGNKIGAFNGLGASQQPIGNLSVDLTKICNMIDGTGGSATCSGVFRDVSNVFGGASCLTVQAMLKYQNTSDPLLDAGAAWYNQVKTDQVKAKDAFDAINNQVAFACP